MLIWNKNVIPGNKRNMKIILTFAREFTWFKRSDALPENVQTLL